MKAKKILKWTLLSILLFPVLLILLLLTPFVWDHYFTYPKWDREVAELNTLRKPTKKYIDTECHIGAFHMHSYWSHDSRGTIEDITDAANATGYKFCFLTDHSHGEQDSFPRGIDGVHNGVLIVPGTEKNGFCAWPLKETVIDWSKDNETVAKKVIEEGGLMYFLHTEQEHNWESPWYQGMEIYNYHTDIMDKKVELLGALFDFVVNRNSYRHWCYFRTFDEQLDIIANWDSLNQKRKIVGIAGQDVHENQGLRAKYLEDGQVEWVGSNAKTITIRQPNWFDKLILPKENVEQGWAFRIMMDTYPTTFNHCANYLFVNQISTDSIKQAINAGHNFISFKVFGDADGFQYFAQNSAGEVSAILGDSIPKTEVKTLMAVSPLPAKFVLKRDGITVEEKENIYEYSYFPTKSGNYRVELYFKFLGKWMPWIYTNNIYITG